MTDRPLRIGFIGAGSIVPTHLAALDTLGRTEVVSICSRTPERAQAAAGLRRLATYTDPDAMLRRERPDAVFVCVPPYAAPGLCQLLATYGIPFLVEKPVAALDTALACQVAAEVERSGLVVAVGYHLRGLDFLAEVRQEIRLRPPELVVARWMDVTPTSEWWGRTELSGGQVIEQTTHLYDLARTLLGEAAVVAASSNAAVARDDPADVSVCTSAIVRFSSGAVGAFINTRNAASTLIELELVSIATIRLNTNQPAWTVTLTDGGSNRLIKVRRSPYVVQAEAFLDAVATDDPNRVLATYHDGLATYLLTRSVVAAASGHG